MTPLARWFRNFLERLLGRYYEGQEPPARVLGAARAFAQHNPRATVGDWVRFHEATVRGTWSEAYIRGVEYVERDRNLWFPEEPPEHFLDAYDPEWRENPIDLNAPVLLDVAEPDLIAAEMQKVNEYAAAMGEPILRAARRG